MGRVNIDRDGFNPYSVNVKGLSRKQAAAARRRAKELWRMSREISEVVRIEENRNERNAWKVRSYLANKERN